MNKILALLVLTLAGIFYWPKVNALIRTVDVGAVDYNRLAKQLELKGVMAPIVQKSKLHLQWLSADQSFVISTLPPLADANIRMEFTSLPDRILHDKPISFYAEGKIKQGKGIITELHFTEGHFIANGFYKVKFSGEGLTDRIVLSKNLKQAGNEYFFEPLFFGDNKLVFDRQLTEYKQNEQLKTKKFHNELIERMSTLSSLLAYLDQLFSTEVSKANKGKDIEIFSNRYSNEVAMIMHGVAIDHKDIQYDLGDDPDEAFLLEKYRGLTAIGREIGEDLVARINQIKEMNKIDLNTKKEMVQNYHQKIAAYQKRIDLEISNVKQNAL